MENFVINIIDSFLSYKRINCLIEVHTEASSKLVSSIMRETIEDFIYSTQLDTKDELNRFNEDVLLLDKFSNTKKKFEKRCEE